MPGAGFHYRRRGESTLVKSERDYRPIVEHIRARHPQLFEMRSIMRLEAATSPRYAIYLPDRSVVRCLTHADDEGEPIVPGELARRLLRTLGKPGYGNCPGHLLVMNTALFETLQANRMLQAVLWVFEQVLLQCTYAACHVVIEHTSGDRAASWEASAYPVDIVPPERTARGEVHIAAVHAQTLVDTVRTRASDSRRFAFEEWKPYHEARLDLRLRLPGEQCGPPDTPLSALEGGEGRDEVGEPRVPNRGATQLTLPALRAGPSPRIASGAGSLPPRAGGGGQRLANRSCARLLPLQGLVDELHDFCTKLGEHWAHEDQGAGGTAQTNRYRCGFAMPWDLYRNIHNLPTVLPLGTSAQDRQAALVVDPSWASAAFAALAPFAAFLRGLGFRVHLAGFGREALCWPANAHELFDSILALPLSLLAPRQQANSFDAYLGTSVRGVSDGDLSAVVGALAGFDLVISVEDSVAHAAAGRLRDLHVETWALLGTGAATAPAAEIVNTCAAFEYAYRRIVVLDPRMAGLCRALGLPPEKLACWSGEKAAEEDEWRRFSSPQVPAAPSFGIARA